MAGFCNLCRNDPARFGYCRSGGILLRDSSMTVRRNAYGRQLGSFHTTANASGIGEIPMTFIRAPYVESVHADAAGEKPEVLSIIQDRIVGVKYHIRWHLHFIRNWIRIQRSMKPFLE